ncbi:hypothetical protein BVRB_9g211310 [Beta vulgaris subsp. vulgaris]|nr:hypothetical protein BVRB_9g211310 [Beta vulgaris subsp. vulgaris]
MDEYVCLRFWHGGVFRKHKLGYLEYVGGEGKTFKVDPDELCWWFLVELVKKCGKYVGIEHIFYCIPGQNLDVGLRRVYNDKEVLEMGAIVMKEKCIDLYVKHEIGQPGFIHFLEGSLEGGPLNEPNLNEANISNQPNVAGPLNQPTIAGPLNQPNLNEPMQPNSDPLLSQSIVIVEQPLIASFSEPLTTAAPSLSQTSNPAETETNPPKEAQTNPLKEAQTNLPPDYHDWYDDRPESPIPWKELIGEDECYSSESDGLYEPETEGSDDDLRELDLEEEVFSADEELREGEDVWEPVNQPDEGEAANTRLPISLGSR